jgi:hypothetical protein
MSKKQGTAHESWLVKRLRDAGFWARRLPEEGTKDEGDVEAVIDGTRWVMEAKARQQLNVQETLGKARAKARVASGQDVPVAVVWKRLVPVAGKKVRQPVAGERTVVILSWNDFVSLLPEGGDYEWGSGS